jgi:osmotically-inducible protein OsmY
LLRETIMTTTTQKDTDKWMRQAVMRELEWDPRVDDSEVAATAHDGAVTLTGYINTYAGKLAAERAAKRVRGVRAVANDIGVRLRLVRTDTDIAADVAQALRLNASIPETVQAAVHNRVVTLTGDAQWTFQAREAERAVRHIKGVHAVHCYIAVVPRAIDRDVRHRIVGCRHTHDDSRHRRRFAGDGGTRTPGRAASAAAGSVRALGATGGSGEP